MFINNNITKNGGVKIEIKKKSPPGMDNTVIKSKTFKYMCRVCLTFTKNLTSLTSPLEEGTSYFEEPWTIQKMLETVTFNKLIIDDKFPSNICHMCLSLLKISYEFQIQFMRSQQILNDSVDEFPVEKPLNLEPELVKCKPSDSQAPVELIYCGNKFDLKDVIVVEEKNDEKNTFDGFLRNLGNEISARFVSDKYDFKSKYKTPTEHQIVIEQVVKPQVKQTDDVVLEEVHDFAVFEDENIIKTLYECETCKKLFDTCQELQTHMYTCYKPCTQFVCDKCGHMAHSQSALYHHLQNHKGKRFKCDQCDKKFVTTSRLKVHLEVHKNERPYLCTVCGKDFNYSVSLKYHMRLHTGEKNYVCNYCGLRYRMPNTLKRHLRTHTKDKPYRCKYCTKCFPSRGEFKCHEMIHTGYRMYKCEYCNKGFTKSSTLTYHYTTHPGPHECHLCSKSFIEVKFLRFHLQRTHKLSDEGDEM